MPSPVFWVDAQLPPALTEWLSEEYGSDFILLLQQQGPPPQVLWVRTGNTRNKDLRRIVLAAWPEAVTLLGGGESLVEIRRKLD